MVNQNYKNSYPISDINNSTLGEIPICKDYQEKRYKIVIMDNTVKYVIIILNTVIRMIVILIINAIGCNTEST